MIYIIFIIIGIIIGSMLVYFKLNPKVVQTQVLDNEIKQQNEKIRKELILLTEEQTKLQTQKEQVLQHIQEMQKQAENASETIYQKEMETIRSKLELETSKMQNELKNSKSKLDEEYKKSVEEFELKIIQAQQDMVLAETRLADLSAKVYAAIEAAKRQEEMETAQDFYKLNIPTIDLEEIQKLRQVATMLRDSEPLNKVIWKVYYEKPFTDLIGRVVGSETKTGIYKITNIKNQKCYIGQCASFSDRWRQHIKRGIGAEAPTRNKLYPAMLEEGVENFTFEIVEECSRDMLNEREDYWQNYFGAKEFGYSIK